MGAKGMKPDLRAQISQMPNQPGVYRYYDKEDNLLYIGKARDLRKRVSSYFTKGADQSYRIRLMTSKIDRIEFTVVPTEYDALLLENSLIKKYQPRYNVSLRDDKTYPYIVIKNERFPRLFATRQRINDGSEYFGPYASVGTMHGVIDLIRKLFPTRSCSYALTKENVEARKFRVCLDYHIKLCKGPCEGFQNEEDYNRNLNQIRSILKGQTGDVMRYLRVQLQKAVDSLEFEKAQEFKVKLEQLESFQAKSTVVNPSITDIDVFSIYSNDKYAFVNYLKIINGTIVTTDTVEYRKRMEEPDTSVLEMAIVELRERYQSKSKEILVPVEMDLGIDPVRFIVPKIGDKRKLLDLSRRNAYIYFQNKLKSIELNKNKRQNEELLTQVKQDLNLKHIPYHIECIDNSNIQGAYPVSAVMVFKNGIPSKKDYRIFNVKTVQGPNDFATMEEVVERRYRRLIEQNEPLPQLIIIDGGKGQLGAAVKVLRQLNLMERLDVISIAKRLEEIYKPGDPIPLSIDKKSQTLKLIQRCRDEAHRFGITRHRKKRITSNLRSALEDIPGVGRKTAEKLLSYFKSVKKMKEATPEEIENLVGKARAEKVLLAIRESEK